MDNELALKLKKQFDYCVQPTECQEELMAEIKAYYEENEKFQKRWNVAAAQRARKHLLNIWHLVRQRRYELADFMYRDGVIQDRKNASKKS